MEGFKKWVEATDNSKELDLKREGLRDRLLERRQDVGNEEIDIGRDLLHRELVAVQQRLIDLARDKERREKPVAWGGFFVGGARSGGVFLARRDNERACDAGRLGESR